MLLSEYLVAQAISCLHAFSYFASRSTDILVSSHLISSILLVLVIEFRELSAAIHGVIFVLFPSKLCYKC